MTKDFNSSAQTIKRVLNIDPNKKMLSKDYYSKTKRRSKTYKKDMLSMGQEINHNKLQIMMFNDEKILTKNGYFNPKNDVVWTDN